MNNQLSDGRSYILVQRQMKHYRKVLEEEVTPLILNIEEQSKHEHHVHHGDDDHDNHSAIH